MNSKQRLLYSGTSIFIVDIIRTVMIKKGVLISEVVVYTKATFRTPESVLISLCPGKRGPTVLLTTLEQ